MEEEDGTYRSLGSDTKYDLSQKRKLEITVDLGDNA